MVLKYILFLFTCVILFFIQLRVCDLFLIESLVCFSLLSHVCCFISYSVTCVDVIPIASLAFILFLIASLVFYFFIQLCVFMVFLCESSLLFY